MKNADAGTITLFLLHFVFFSFFVFCKKIGVVCLISIICKEWVIRRGGEKLSMAWSFSILQIDF